MGKRLTTSRPTTLSTKAASANSRPIVTDEEIRRRAYAIYMAKGGQPGNELADWFQARQELEQELLQPA